MTRRRTARSAVTATVLAVVALTTAQTSGASGASSGLLARTDLIYGSEIGAWLPNGGANVNESSGVPTRIRDAHVRVIRFAVYDCFKNMTCGNDNHTGTIARSDFDAAVRGITTTDNAVLWLKMVPIASDTIGVISGTRFCPPWTGAADHNLPMYKKVIAEVKTAGYTGPLVIESNNEMEYACSKLWQSQGAPISSAGSVGVSRRIGQHYAATMPALKAYARSLGFSDVVVGGYIGVGGGPGWGQACNPDATKPFAYACAYSTRWVSEFNTAVHAAYVSSGGNPDYIPDFESIHAYPHSPDFSSAPGYGFDDKIAFAYYRNWIAKSRAVADGVWGATIGDDIRFSISEWSAGSANSSGTWSGWTTRGRPDQFFSGWYQMLRGDGNTTGTGSAYWSANLFVTASESDTGTSRYYNIIRKDGSVPAWYSTFKDYSTGVR
jgi:hypothetical protein